MTTVQVQLRLSPQVRAAATVRAKAEDRTLSGWIKHLLHRELGMDGTEAVEVPDDVQGRVTPVEAPPPVEVPAPGKRKTSVRCTKHKRLNCKNCVPGT